MNKWLIGARIKTLPAAISPVLIGTSYAEQITWINAALALIVALFLQIAVNFANDGDQWNNVREKFLTHTRSIDRIRDENFWQVFPELNKLRDIED
ncbi:MAG: hypothetical protein ACOVLB_08650 [Candidatus Nanopelagicus sp.]